VPHVLQPVFTVAGFQPLPGQSAQQAQACTAGPYQQDPNLVHLGSSCCLCPEEDHFMKATMLCLLLLLLLPLPLLLLPLLPLPLLLLPLLPAAAAPQIQLCDRALVNAAQRSEEAWSWGLRPRPVEGPPGTADLAGDPEAACAGGCFRGWAESGTGDETRCSLRVVCACVRACVGVGGPDNAKKCLTAYDKAGLCCIWWPRQPGEGITSSSIATTQQQQQLVLCACWPCWLLAQLLVAGRWFTWLLLYLRQ